MSKTDKLHVTDLSAATELPTLTDNIVFACSLNGDYWELVAMFESWGSHYIKHIKSNK